MAFVILLFVGRVAAADGKGAVALLPLDSDQRLELYGQPVASEIARALVAGGVDIVVVGKKMSTPATAVLIVDGTIAAKGEAVVITLRIRKRADGTTLDSLAATSATLATLDKAASDLSSRLLPMITTKLAHLDDPPVDPDPNPKPPVVDPKPLDPKPAPPPAKMMVAISGTGPLAAPLEAAVDAWIGTHARTPAHVAAKDLTPATVLHEHTEFGIAFEVLGYSVNAGVVPTARARVRVRIAAPTAIVFDRVIATDTVVGDKGLDLGKLAARVATEVLAIMRPHMRRSVEGWR